MGSCHGSQAQMKRYMPKEDKSAKARCFRCGEFGHMGGECPSPVSLCFHCHQPGHLSRECPQKHQNQRQ